MKTKSAIGLRFTRNGEEKRIASRKADAKETAELPGWTFTGPAAVR